MLEPVLNDIAHQRSLIHRRGELIDDVIALKSMEEAQVGKAWRKDPSADQMAIADK